jgi:chromosome segregation ATPase
VDGDVMERVRRAELEAAQFAQDLETQRQRQEAERAKLRAEMNALQAESEMHRRQAEEARLALEQMDSILPTADPGAQPELDTLRGQLAEALAQVKSLEAQVRALEEELQRGARPAQAAQWLERIASLEARLRELQPLQERQADLERERLATRSERRKAAAYLKERAGVRRRLEEIHQQLEALKLT